MNIDQMIERLRAISKWNSEHGFSNRGVHSASVDANELEKAYELVSMAYQKILSWEISFHFSRGNLRSYVKTVCQDYTIFRR